MRVNIGPFEISPNFEREIFVYKKLGNQEEVFVNRVEIKMRQNSHHFLIHDFSEEFTDRPVVDQIRDIRQASGTMNTIHLLTMLHHKFIAGAQSTYMDWQFPEGIALYFPAGAALDFNSHYVNKKSTPITGEVNVNFYTIPAATVKSIARPLQLGNTSLNLPPKQRTTVSKTFIFEKKVKIIALTSHTHQLGEKFVIRIAGGPRHGEVIYTNTYWHHPVIARFNDPVVLNPGEGLTSEITYNNTRDKTIYFGLTSEDEMGIIFGYFIEE
jgi:hypothetical protein